MWEFQDNLLGLAEVRSSGLQVGLGEDVRLFHPIPWEGHRPDSRIVSLQSTVLGGELTSCSSWMVQHTTGVLIPEAASNTLACKLYSVLHIVIKQL